MQSKSTDQIEDSLATNREANTAPNHNGLKSLDYCHIDSSSCKLRELENSIGARFLHDALGCVGVGK